MIPILLPGVRLVGPLANRLVCRTAAPSPANVPTCPPGAARRSARFDVPTGDGRPGGDDNG